MVCERINEEVSGVHLPARTLGLRLVLETAACATVHHRLKSRAPSRQLRAFKTSGPLQCRDASHTMLYAPEIVFLLGVMIGQGYLDLHLTGVTGYLGGMVIVGIGIGCCRGGARNT